MKPNGLFNQSDKRNPLSGPITTQIVEKLLIAVQKFVNLVPEMIFCAP